VGLAIQFLLAAMIADGSMQTLREYLGKHYINLEQLASLTGIQTLQIQQLIDAKLAPAPSYIVTPNRKLISCVFGEFDAQDAAEGDYFHRNAQVWITRAKESHDRLGAVAAKDDLRTRFKSKFVDALREINDSTVRLPDTFSASGQPIASRVEERFEEAWEALVEGVYSLCVADPSNERSIARKEMLQEYLQGVSAKVGAGESLLASERNRVLSLIRQYAEAAMPFAPPEYPRSSRKRLVEDFAMALRRGSK
jgi:hypothetical protein